MKGEGDRSILRRDLVEITRRRIKDAAKTCFAREGYRLTAIRKIAKEAGTTPATLYQHFDGKAGILISLTDATIPALVDVAGRLDDLIEGLTIEAVRAWLDDYSRIWRENRVVFVAYWEAFGDPEVGNHFWPMADEQAGQMTTLLSRFPANNALEARMRISLLFISISQSLFVAHSSGEPEKIGLVLDALADILWNSLSRWWAQR